MSYKTTIVIAGLLLFSFKGFSQMQVGIKAGLGITNNTQRHYYQDLEGFNFPWKTGSNYALSVSIPLNNWLEANMDIGYATKSFGYGSSDINKGQSYNLSRQYFQAPVSLRAYYRGIPKMKLFIGAGVYYGDLVKATVKGNGYIDLLADKSTPYNNHASYVDNYENQSVKREKTDLGYLGSIGATYRVYKNIHALLEVNYQKSFTNIERYADDGGAAGKFRLPSKSQAFYINAGLVMDLKHK